MTIRLLIVDDHEVVRKGFCSLLADQEGVEIVAEAAQGREGLAKARQLSPDLVLMDLEMPDMNGIVATTQIRMHCPETQVLGLSMHADDRFVTEMLRAGARGYLLKSCRLEELLRAIRTVVAGGVFLSAEVARSVMDRLDKQAVTDPQPPDLQRLTSREIRVLQMLAEGRTSKQIASALGLSVRTIDSHRQKMMDKLELYSVAELTKFAVRERLTPPA